MFNRKKIKLSSYQATAYWWVCEIKSIVRTLSIEKTKNKNELEFIKVFYNYTDIDWRNLYLELAKYIEEDVLNYVPHGYMGLDCFSQDTALTGHDRLNSELARITKCHIPDIRLANSSRKDSVIYTDYSCAYEWYKSCGTRPLDMKYEPCYILTGDKEELDFYNLLVATMVSLDNMCGKGIKSISDLRDGFCQEYMNVNKLDCTMEELVEKFNYFFNRAYMNDNILGRWYEGETYMTCLRDIDYVGLDEYMKDAKQYANAVLGISKNSKKTGYSRKRKKNNDSKQLKKDD